MLALSFTFPAGRYHAMPWDRHVNEGAVAWPPEPWRLLRALIATWHHKVKWTGKHTETTVSGLVESLARELPEYTVPPASHSHTRHYMPQFAADRTTLVFDAFAAVKPDDALTVVWPTLELPNDQTALLDELLAVMGYLGRSESWVEAQRLSKTQVAPPGTSKCKPGTDTLDRETGEIKGEVVTLFAPLTADDYRTLRDQFLTDKRTIKKLGDTLPDNLLDALSVETSDLRRLGWNQPPAARKVSYLRPIDALRPQRVVRTPPVERVTTARFILTGKPLPRVEDSLRIGELLRMAIMSQAKNDCGEHAIPSVLSGHDLPQGNQHRHAFYLAWDANGDGRIDRLLLHAPAGIGATERRIVSKTNRLWSRDGYEWGLVLENIGGTGVGGAVMGCSTEWRSITPYLHPWYVKKKLAIEDQICRECRERGLPEPIGLQRLESILVGKEKCSRKRRPVHFRRFRGKRGLNQPDRHGSFWRLTFAEPISGPLSLGFACHFGLGLFAPVMLEGEKRIDAP